MPNTTASERIYGAFSAEARRAKLEDAEAKAVGTPKAKKPKKPKKKKKSRAQRMDDDFWS